MIKELPSLVPSDDGLKKTTSSGMKRSEVFYSSCNPEEPVSGHRVKDRGSEDKVNEFSSSRKMPSAEYTLQKMLENDSVFQTRAEVVANLSVSKTASTPRCNEPSTKSNLLKSIGEEPTEVAFFKLLHSEVKKGVYFFCRAEKECTIREERIREGMEIVKASDRVVSSDRWSTVAKSLYRLYKDLLLLETYAVMSYCSFSKILKKHDKVTGHCTRRAFMSNVVAKANFSNYPKLLNMISRCEVLYEEVSRVLVLEGKECLQEDERLFINMILCLNEQVIDGADEEDVHIASERKDNNKNSVLASSILRSRSNISSTREKLISSFKALVNENDQKATPVAGDDTDDKISVTSQEDPSRYDIYSRCKRQRTEKDKGV